MSAHAVECAQKLAHKRRRIQTCTYKDSHLRACTFVRARYKHSRSQAPRTVACTRARPVQSTGHEEASARTASATSRPTENHA
eukprot:6173969-Pleurochrysis_carterae.AAC.1